MSRHDPSVLKSPATLPASCPLTASSKPASHSVATSVASIAVFTVATSAGSPDGWARQSADERKSAIDSDASLR
jgi:hypothetical protein